MKIARKLLIGTFAATLIISCNTPLHAADTGVDAGIQTRAAIEVTKISDISFGTVDYTPTHSGIIQLATDGTVSLSGASGLTMSGAPTAASLNLSGDGASIIDLACDLAGTLSDGASNTLPLSGIEYVVDTGTSFGSGTPCAGIGSVSGSIDLSANATPTLLMGAAIDTSTTPIASNALYSTANGGGDPVTLRVTYQ